jgi:integrase
MPFDRAPARPTSGPRPSKKTGLAAPACITITPLDLSRIAGRNVSPRNTTVTDRSQAEVTLLADVFDRFAREIIQGLKGAKSEHSRIQLLTKSLGHISLAQIRPQALAEYRDKRLTQVGPQSVKHELGLLNRALKLAHREWGYILPFGIPSVTKPKLPQGRVRRLNSNEEASLLSALRESPIVQCAVRVAIETAMRRGEILNIKSELLVYRLS